MHTMLPVKYLNLHLKTISNLQNVNQVGSASFSLHIYIYEQIIMIKQWDEIFISYRKFNYYYLSRQARRLKSQVNYKS